MRLAALLLFAASSALTGCGEATPPPPLQEKLAKRAAPKPEPLREPVVLDIRQVALLDTPWALAFAPGIDGIFATLAGGTVVRVSSNGTITPVKGAPQVGYDGQGGIGDIAFPPDFASSREIYLTWVEKRQARDNGFVVGRGKLDCAAGTHCTMSGLVIIWRQFPRTGGFEHYSQRLAFSPDGQHLFVASGDRHEFWKVQRTDNGLGKVLRLRRDGTPAPGNPYAGKGPAKDEIWSMGHRNILGLAFDSAGNLWAAEHGPVGGDELNRIEAGRNYGWPLVSEGVHGNNRPIPAHRTRPDLAAPALAWTPVIAPSGMIIHSGRMFTPWKGQALIAGLKSRAIIRVGLDGDAPRELERYPMNARIRAIAEAPDGAIWIAEEGQDARLLRITPER